MNIQELATAVVNELPIIICIFNNSYLGNVRQWQEMFYQKHYSQTCLRRRKSCAAICNTPTQNCPEYTPDFIRLAESYGAKGIRVTEESEIADALTYDFRRLAKECIIKSGGFHLSSTYRSVNQFSSLYIKQEFIQ